VCVCLYLFVCKRLANIIPCKFSFALCLLTLPVVRERKREREKERERERERERELFKEFKDFSIFAVNAS
jgi:hypothetical protein